MYVFLMPAAESVWIKVEDERSSPQDISFEDQIDLCCAGDGKERQLSSVRRRTPAQRSVQSKPKATE